MVGLDLAVEVAEEEACRSDSADVVQESSISDIRGRLVFGGGKGGPPRFCW